MNGFERDKGANVAVKLVDNWKNKSYSPTSRNQDFANGFIDRVSERLKAGEKSVYGAVLEGASAGAAELNVDAFHGISELLQNADDLEATELQAYVRSVSGQKYLFVKHNGNTVEPRHVLAMTLAFLSTKKNDPNAIGKFGIGLKTCARFSSCMEVHCTPYHFLVKDNSLTRCEPSRKVENFYDPLSADTLIVFRLLPDFDFGVFEEWVSGWDDASLVFLRHLHRFHVQFRNKTNKEFIFQLNKETKENFKFRYVARSCEGKRTLVSATNSKRVWQLYSYQFPVPKKLTRSFKETALHADISIAVSDTRTGGRFFAGLPLNIKTGFPCLISSDFDPDTSRERLQHKPFNEWLLARLADAIPETASRLFELEPKFAWFTVPLEGESDTLDSWLNERLKQAYDRARTRIAQSSQIRVRSQLLKLNQLSFPSKQAQRAIGISELEKLRPDLTPVPTSMRDRAGRWREVLEKMVPDSKISAIDALVLCDDDEFMHSKKTGWLIRLVSCAIGESTDRYYHIGDVFFNHKIVPLANGLRVIPPHPMSHDPALAKSTSNAALATKFGLATPIDPELAQGNSADAKHLLEWLTKNSRLVDALEATEIIKAFISALSSRPTELDDETLVNLRNTFSQVDIQKRQVIGKQLGQLLLIQTTAYKNGKRTKSLRSVNECYLSNAYVKEKGAWSALAKNLEGVRWIDNRYVNILKSAEVSGSDKKTQAAASFFHFLGALSCPRIVEIGIKRYGNWWEAPERIKQVLEDTNWTKCRVVTDYSSPDLVAVLSHIAKEKSTKQRKARAYGLFQLLSRNWDRYYRDFSEATLEYRYYSWYGKPGLDATWIANLRSSDWLPNLKNQWRAPEGLIAKSELMLAIYGEVDEKTCNFKELDDQGKALAETLGIITRSPGSHLLKLIKKTRDDTDPLELLDLRYAALSSLCPEKPINDWGKIDDLTVGEIRQEFGVRKGSKGLIYWLGDWYSAADVRRGKDIFHGRRPVMQDSAAYRKLWRALQIKVPTLEDCVECLVQLSREEVEEANEALVTDVLRYLMKLKIGKKRTDSKLLSSIPLLTSSGWCTERPVYHTSDGVLSDALSEVASVWKPPCREEDLAGLCKRMSVITISLSDFERVQNHLDLHDLSEMTNEVFVIAKHEFQKRCQKSSEGLANGFSLGWASFQKIRVKIDPALQVLIKLQGKKKRNRFPCSVYFDTENLVLWLKDEDSLYKGEAVGRRFAELFKNHKDREFVELAWQVAMQDASTQYCEFGEVEAALFTLAEEEQIGDPLKNLAEIAKSAGRYKSNLVTSHDAKPSKEGKSQALKPINQLLPWLALETVEISVATETSPNSSRKVKKFGLRSTIPTGRPVVGSKSSFAANRSRPDPIELEKRALICLQHVMHQVDKGEIEDTSHLRGVGSDAVLNDKNMRREFMEIKSFTGAAPSQVTFTRNEAERAREQRKNFWLVVVSGLASDVVTLSIYNDPLNTLNWSYAGNISLKNLKNSNRLSFELSPQIEK